jgi:hypothetical protein
MRRYSFPTAILTLSFVAGGSALASAHPAQHGSIYSNLCTEAESGDVAGYRIVIDRSASPPSVSFDWGEGGLMGPAMVSDVSYDPRSGAMRFNADANGRAVSFSGRISVWQLAGTLTWINNPRDAPERERVQLRRVHRLDVQPRCG